MRKILLRATMNPFDTFPTLEMLNKNYLGNNSGNLLFPFSLTKALMTEDTIIDTTNRCSYSDKEIEQLNAEYDYFVIALANAFRPDFIPYLKKLTKLVKKLTIPCCVVGVGLQAGYEPDLSAARSFDKDVHEFVSAVLEKSSSIGVRGEITAEYLKKLGFSQIDLIGCPSMFLHGDNLTQREKTVLNQDSVISMNTSSGMPLPVVQLLERTRVQFPNLYFVPQENKELLLLYSGVPFPKRYETSIYPSDLSHPLYLENKVRFFTNVPTWLDYTEKIDFSCGTRIHGNIAAVLGGAPTYIFAPDSRVRELAAYHEIPFMPLSQVNENTNIMKLYDNTDFSRILRNHSKRFYHYIEFLDNNNLPHISMEQWHGKSPFSEKVANSCWEQPIGAITAVSKTELAERLTIYGKYTQEKIEALSVPKAVPVQGKVSGKNKADKPERAQSIMKALKKKAKKWMGTGK